MAVSDLLPSFGVDAVHVLNHPGNGVLVALARRVQEALGVPVDAPEPERVLLGGIRAPLERGVLEALGLDVALAREHWLVGGEPVDGGDRRRGAAGRGTPPGRTSSPRGCGGTRTGSRCWGSRADRVRGCCSPTVT